MKSWEIIKRGIFIAFIIVLIFADSWERKVTERRTKKEMNGLIRPAPDPNKGNPLYYSIQIGDWIYPSQSRAKALIEDNEPYKDIEQYLQDRIPKYKEDTYWGEQWDWEDEEEWDWENDEE